MHHKSMKNLKMLILSERTLLLNVGPHGNGIVQDEAIAILLEANPIKKTSRLWLMFQGLQKITKLKTKKQWMLLRDFKFHS